MFLGLSKVSAIAKEDFAANSKSPTAEKVPGLKKSFYDTGTVTFIKGKSFVNLQFLGTIAGDDSVVAEALGTLAKKAAKRL